MIYLDVTVRASAGVRVTRSPCESERARVASLAAELVVRVRPSAGIVDHVGAG